MIGGGIVVSRLRLIEIGNQANLLAGLQVDHRKGVIVEGGGEQALARNVDAHVIHAPVDIGQRDALRQLKGRGLAKGQARQKENHGTQC